MPHSWKAYEKAKKITDQLVEGKFIREKDVMMIRGIIQLVLEED